MTFWEITAVILAMAAATALTRFLPFWLPSRWLELPLVRTLKDGLPAVILLLLVIYSLKDTKLTAAPWGLNEGLALAVVIILHLWKRNALLSITGGTALYMVFVQTNCFSSLFR